MNALRAILVTALLALAGTASAQTPSEIAPFVGSWSGNLGATPIVLDLFANDGNLNATSTFAGVPQNLVVLGYKSQIPGFYLWRTADKAAICFYFEGSSLVLTYFEKDTVRKAYLSRR